MENQIKNILAGNLKEIAVPYKLQQGEKAYFQFQTKRKADVEYRNSRTIGVAKKKGVVGRAIVGDLAFGRAGAIIGGATADTEIHTSTSESRSSRREEIDAGMMIFTNRRMVFIGKEIASILYDDIISFYFPNPLKSYYPNTDRMMEIKYASMLKNEAYTVPSPQVELYFQGIQHLLKNDKSPIKQADIDKFLNDEFITSDRIISPILEDGSIDCPGCGRNIKEYKERKNFFSKTREYTCPNCGHITFK